MVNGIGDGGLGRSAIEAALKGLRERAASARLDVQPQEAEGSSFADKLREGVGSLNETVGATDELPLRVVKGELDFHEVAAQLKESELSFEFAMQVRNKLIDAYREVMRMNV